LKQGLLWALIGNSTGIGGIAWLRMLKPYSTSASVHEGAIGNFSARYWSPLGKMFDGVLGVGLQIADINYMNTYFGVSASDSFLSGLPIYQPSGGVASFRIFPGVVTHLSPHWHLATGFRYERLVGDAKNSPVVSTVGSPDQWIAGMGVAYSW
jgi:outer membrane scaffolding protein for murein synthesis (MipA/OmpV family)